MKLKSGGTLDADLVVVGVGVRPRIALAEAAGLAIDRGVTVDAHSADQRAEHLRGGRHRALARSAHGRKHPGRALGGRRAAGPDRGAEHAGLRPALHAVPFFWSQHYDIPINYVGHAEKWDDIAIEGDIANKDCVLRYRRGGKVLAVASIFRDKESLEAEIAMERRAGMSSERSG